MSTSESVPALVDIAHYQGDTFRRSITVTDADITNWTWKGDLRRQVADVDPTAEASFVFEPVTSKEVLFSLTAAVTATLSGRYVYDVEAVTDAGDVITFTAGNFTVRQQVTP